MFEGEVFHLSESHLILLQNMIVGWQDCEFGAPEINPKRPYGNSNVVEDVAALLGVDAESNYDVLEQLHKETKQALQIVLLTGLFEPGVYQQMDRYDKRSWERID
jgi:hypothetical protein